MTRQRSQLSYRGADLNVVTIQLSPISEAYSNGHLMCLCLHYDSIYIRHIRKSMINNEKQGGLRDKNCVGWR